MSNKLWSIIVHWWQQLVVYLSKELQTVKHATFDSYVRVCLNSSRPGYSHMNGEVHHYLFREPFTNIVKVKSLPGYVIAGPAKFGVNYLSIPKLQRYNSWNLGMINNCIPHYMKYVITNPCWNPVQHDELSHSVNPRSVDGNVKTLVTFLQFSQSCYRCAAALDNKTTWLWWWNT